MEAGTARLARPQPCVVEEGALGALHSVTSPSSIHFIFRGLFRRGALPVFLAGSGHVPFVVVVAGLGTDGADLGPGVVQVGACTALPLASTSSMTGGRLLQWLRGRRSRLGRTPWSSLPVSLLGQGRRRLCSTFRRGRGLQGPSMTTALWGRSWRSVAAAVLLRRLLPGKAVVQLLLVLSS